MNSFKQTHSKEMTNFFHTCEQSSSSVTQTELLRFSQSPIHGIGGFARGDITAGTRVIEYVGRRIDKAESLRQCQQRNQCLFALDDSFDLDGNVPWNQARFINHSCRANCEARLDQGRVWIIASREIRAGEEITFNYNFDLEDYNQYPCHCGSRDCVGYIVAEEFFDHVRVHRRLATEAKHDS